MSRRAKLQARLAAHGKFGGSVKRQREPLEPPSSMAYFSKHLPAIQDYRCSGRPLEGARELRSTVAPQDPGMPGRYLPLPPDVCLGIMRAYDALPPGAIVRFASVRDLFERPQGAMRAQIAEQAVSFAAMRRGAMKCALLASAVRAGTEGAGAGGAAAGAFEEGGAGGAGAGGGEEFSAGALSFPVLARGTRGARAARTRATGAPALQERE